MQQRQAQMHLTTLTLYGIPMQNTCIQGVIEKTNVNPIGSRVRDNEGETDDGRCL